MWEELVRQTFVDNDVNDQTYHHQEEQASQYTIVVNVAGKLASDHTDATQQD